MTQLNAQEIKTLTQLNIGVDQAIKIKNPRPNGRGIGGLQTLR